LLAIPLDEPLPRLSPEERYVDVHSGNRDQIAGDSYEALKKYNDVVLNDTEAENHVQEMIGYIKTIKNGKNKNIISKISKFILENKRKAKSLGSTKAALALTILTEPANGNLNWRWQPLNGNDIRVGGSNINGTIFLAHIWQYCNKQGITEKEKENRLSSLITGLSESVEDNQRVCPPGQMQHLVTSLLNVNLAKLTTTTDAVRVFFESSFSNEDGTIKPHKDITTVEEMNLAISKFLRENPLINNKDEFLQQMETYWINQDYKGKLSQNSES
jgi:hypothetical protein